MQQLIPLVLLFLGLIWIWESARWLIFIFAALIAGLIYYVVSSTARVKEEQRALQQQADRAEKERLARGLAAFQAALKLVEHHKKTLSRRANQTIYKDAYGAFVFDKWFAERDYFIENVLCREIPDLQSPIDKDMLREIITERALTVDEVAETVPNLVPEDMTSEDFEHFCATLLQADGWNVRVTPPTGDQGIDVIGQIGELKAVFQCKLYSNPVGNGAVQEIIAGKHFEQADLAAVITNSTYTPAARTLAASADVLLLHFTEVPGLIRRLSDGGQAST